MNTKARVKRLEALTNPPAPNLIGVYFTGDTHITCNGRRYTHAEWKAMSPNNEHIHVRLNWGDEGALD